MLKSMTTVPYLWLAASGGIEFEQSSDPEYYHFLTTIIDPGASVFGSKLQEAWESGSFT